MEARVTEKLWELVQGTRHLLERSRGTGSSCTGGHPQWEPRGCWTGFQGGQGERKRGGERESEREREIPFSHCPCQPFLTPSQKDPTALQRGRAKSSFYDKILLWPRICYVFLNSWKSFANVIRDFVLCAAYKAFLCQPLQSYRKNCLVFLSPKNIHKTQTIFWNKEDYRVTRNKYCEFLFLVPYFTTICF